ncbi:unnamed protein product [Paramecium octaurelia]|uniref:Uncharacterized protein n=1 Tax=Paramecium octaurelia TaxID=43137 RepID=A0A8S1YJP3_PAROT|nr:unnamed protein product [Paramecium octaurelia]
MFSGQIKQQQITTIEQSKERILKIKNQQLEIKNKENQSRLSYYKNILEQIMDFKRFIDDSLEKIYKQIQQYIYPIQKEKQELNECQLQLNYFEDITQLSELYFQGGQSKSAKLVQDNNFIDEITRQFELLFNNAEYFQTLDTFKKTKQTIQDIMENNTLELPPLVSATNESKTPHLNRICTNHKKEIIMIDMDSQNKKIEDRFVCVDCIAENPQTKYSTIETINKQWRAYNSESEKMLSQYEQESTNKKKELFNQITYMRKSYNQKLNEICDKLIAEQFQPIDRSKYTKYIRRVKIQALEDEQLFKDLQQLIEKQKVIQSQTITSLKNKDSIFKKEIENHLESLKKYYQQDVQHSIDILKEISIERNLILELQESIQQFSNCAQKKEENKQGSIEIINDIQELIDQAKNYQCQLNLFDQTVILYQQHTCKIDQINQKIQNFTKDHANKSELMNPSYENLLNILNDYTNNLNNKSKQMKKYCNIEKFESDLIKLTDLNQILDDEKKSLLMQLDQKQQEHHDAIIKLTEKNQHQINEINAKFQQNEKENLTLLNQKSEEITNLKKLNEEEKLNVIKNLENIKNSEILELNTKINQKESELQIIKSQFDQVVYSYNYSQIQYLKPLLFSNIYKHNSCQVSEGGKVVECNGGYYSCLCEYAIPKTGKISITFQMLKIGSYAFVGIGFRDFIQKNSYSGYGNGGQYLISSDRYTCSHHNKQIIQCRQNLASLLMIGQQWKQVLNKNTLNGLKQQKNKQQFWIQIHPYHKNYILACVFIVPKQKYWKLIFFDQDFEIKLINQK